MSWAGELVRQELGLVEPVELPGGERGVGDAQAAVAVASSSSRRRE